MEYQWRFRLGFRLAVGVIGVVLLVFAILWSWSSRPEAVVLAVLGIGTLLLYLAYSGQLLSGLTAGGVEATFVEVVDAVAQNPDIPGEAKEQLAEIVRKGEAPIAVRQRARSFSAAHRQALDFENEVKAKLKELNPKWTLEPLKSGGPFDFTITSGNGNDQTVRVECRWAAKPPTAELFKRWTNMAEDQGGTTLGDGILLVVSELPPNTQAEPGVIWWKSQPPDQELKTKIANAFRPILPAQPAVQQAAQPAVQQAAQPAVQPEGQ